MLPTTSILGQVLEGVIDGTRQQNSIVLEGIGLYSSEICHKTLPQCSEDLERDRYKLLGAKMADVSNSDLLLSNRLLIDARIVSRATKNVLRCHVSSGVSGTSPSSVMRHIRRLSLSSPLDVTRILNASFHDADYVLWCTSHSLQRCNNAINQCKCFRI